MEIASSAYALLATINNGYNFKFKKEIFWIHGVIVSALDFYPGDQGSIPRQVEIFINLKCSFRMGPWEDFTREGLLPTMC